MSGIALESTAPVSSGHRAANRSKRAGFRGAIGLAWVALTWLLSAGTACTPSAAIPLQCRGAHVAAVHYHAPIALACAAPGPPSAVTRVGTPAKVFQLLGDEDRELSPPLATRNQTLTRAGVAGADLGYPVVLPDGRLMFLFADANPQDPDDPRRPRDADVVGWTEDASGQNADSGFDLQFYTDTDGKYLGLRVDGLFLCRNDGPSAAFTDGPTLYAFFNEGADNGEVDPRTQQANNYGFLARSADEGRTFHRLYELPSSEMVFIQPVTLADTSDGATASGLPWGGAPTEYFFGRRDDDAPILAAVQISQVEDPTTWQWWTGNDASGKPQWSSQDGAAKRVFCKESNATCPGNFSVSFVPGLGKWLMLTRCDAAPDPTGALPYISYRTADSAFGPWSPPLTYFSAENDGGYCHFMHRCCDAPGDSACVSACCDEDFTPPYDRAPDVAFGETNNAFPYGPYVLPTWDQWDAATRTATIYSLVSTGNPYTPQLLKTGLHLGP